MDALADLRLRDRAVLIEDTLVLADLHVGRGVASNVELPVGVGEEMVDRVRALCAAFEPETIVVAGDLLHSFDSVPRLVEGTTRGLTAVARDVGAEMVVTPGNHDTMLDAVWSGPTTPEYRVGETVITHGHVDPAADADRYVVGHDHPTITIEGQNRPCYLAGDGVYRGADLVMLPAFSRLPAGATINAMSSADFLSPLVTQTGALAPVVCDEEAGETLEFPPLEAFRHRL